MTTEQENKYLRQVLVDLWSFFGENKNPEDYIHDLDQIRGVVTNHFLALAEKSHPKVETKYQRTSENTGAWFDCSFDEMEVASKMGYKTRTFYVQVNTISINPNYSYEELKRLMQERYPPLKLTDR